MNVRCIWPCYDRRVRQRVVILGAGPAGSTAAILLARNGLDVTLVEKARFPRGKVCGECISALGVAVLDRLGLLTRMNELGATTLTRAAIISATGTECSIELPSLMRGLSRELFDVMLIDAARSAGVEIRQPCRATFSTSGDIHFDGHRVDADFILISTGDQAGWAQRPALTGDFGIKAHYIGIDTRPDTIELIALADGSGYAGLSPIECERWNTAWSVPGEMLRSFDGDVEALFDATIASNPSLRQRFRRAHRVGTIYACALPRYRVKQPTRANTIAIGNAAAALEPIGGEGMGLAMRSGEIAAEEVIHASRQYRPVDHHSIQQQFESLWQTRQVACRTGAKLLESSTLGSLAIDLADRFPAVARIGLSLVGK